MYVVAFYPQVKSWCNVEYVKLDFSKYPRHVRNNQVYSWKPIIIMVTKYLRIDNLVNVYHINPWSDITWALWRLKSPAILLFAQMVLQTNINDTLKFLITGPLSWSESISEPVDPYKGS